MWVSGVDVIASPQATRRGFLKYNRASLSCGRCIWYLTVSCICLWQTGVGSCSTADLSLSISEYLASYIASDIAFVYTMYPSHRGVGSWSTTACRWATAPWGSASGTGTRSWRTPPQRHAPTSCTPRRRAAWSAARHSATRPTPGAPWVSPHTQSAHSWESLVSCLYQGERVLLCCLVCIPSYLPVHRPLLPRQQHADTPCAPAFALPPPPSSPVPLLPSRPFPLSLCCTQATRSPSSTTWCTRGAGGRRWTGCWRPTTSQSSPAGKGRA